MWMRFEAMEKTLIVVLLILTTIFFLLFSQEKVSGQELPEWLMRIVELEVETGGGDIETLVDYYENLSYHPLNINRASEKDFERLGFLSDFQIASILDYRSEYGDIFSSSELSLIDGFNSKKVSDILPFISFGTDFDFKVKTPSKLDEKLILRSKRKYEKDTLPGIPYYLYMKYRLRYGEHYQFGFLLENDSYERKLPDFSSGYLLFSDIPLISAKRFKLSSLVIGDYSLRMGQGLVIWNSFSLSGFGDPSSVFKKESGVIPYSSSDEQNFYRGVGTSFEVGHNWNFSVFASGNMIDAKADEQYYYSLPEGGIHVSESQMGTRNQMVEHLFGGNVSYRMKHLKIGTTAAVYSYNKANKRRVAEYNKFQMYDGWWGNMSVDAYLVLKKMRFFSELAVDFSGTFAVLVGGIVSLTNSLDLSVLLRHYPKDYIAPHSGAYSSVSACANETGALINLKWSIGRRASLITSLDLINHPWMRFGVDAPSNVIKQRVQFDYSFNSSHSLSCRGSYSYNNFHNNVKIGQRLGYSFDSGSGIAAGCKLEMTWSSIAEGKLPLGAMFLLECGYKALNGKWEASLRSTLYHIDDWENRIYCYERDLPQSFSVPALYGRGVAFYCLLRLKPVKWLDLIIKVSDKMAKMQVNLLF